MPTTPVDRLLTKPITLHYRALSGDDDAWGSPILMEDSVETKCYYRLMRTGDSSDEGNVVWEFYDVFLPANTPIYAYDAVTLDGNRMEVIGVPDPEWNARVGEVNHVKLRVGEGVAVIVNVSVKARWQPTMDNMALGRFFGGPEAVEYIESIGEAVVGLAEDKLEHVSKPGKEAHTAVTESAEGKKIWWSTDPDAVAKRLFTKPPQFFPLELPGGGATVQLISLVIADHPNSENFQYGLDGFPVTRFFTGALDEVAHEIGRARWTEF